MLIDLRLIAVLKERRSILAVAQKPRILLDDIRQHEEYHAHAALHRLHRKLRAELLRDFQKLLCIHGADLTDAEYGIAENELLEILMQDLVRRLISKRGSRTEHLLCVISGVHARDLCERKTSDLVARRAGRRAEQQRVGDDGRHHKACDLLRDLDPVLMEHGIEDRAGAADRLPAEIDRIDRLDRTDSMVIDDLKDLGLLQIIHRLRNFRVVDQDDLLLLCVQKILGSDHADILVLVIQDRIRAMAELAHRLADIVNKVIQMEGDQSVLLHEELGRDRLIDQTGYRVCVEFRADNDALFVLCRHADDLGDLFGQTAHDRAGSHLDRCELRVHAVAQDDQILRLHISGEALRRGSSDNNTAFREDVLLISDHDVTVDRLRDIIVFCLRLGHDRLGIGIHVVIRDVRDCDHAFQLIRAVHDRKSRDAALLHIFPGNTDRDIIRSALRLIDVHILDLCSDIRHIERRIYTEILQDEFCLLIDLACASRQITIGLLDLIFQIRQ